MSMDHSKLPGAETGLPAGTLTPGRNRPPAAARAAAMICAAGLALAGTAGAAAARQDKEDATDPAKGAGGGPHVEAVTPSSSKLQDDRKLPAVQGKLPAVQRKLPAVQRRQLKLLLDDALRTGNSRLALKRHPKLKLNARQKQALLGMSKRDWRQLRRLKAKLKPLQLRITPN